MQLNSLWDLSIANIGIYWKEYNRVFFGHAEGSAEIAFFLFQ